MRKLRRPVVLLPTLVEMTTHYELNKEFGDGGPPDDKWKDPDVRGAIYAMHGRSCAYCQKRVTDGVGDVEHFRPKSEYIWLKYDFSNYFLGCTPCNRYRKQSKFPLMPGIQKVVFENRNLLPQEKQVLLDPESDPVEEWTRLNWEDPDCMIVPTAEAVSDPEIGDRVTSTIAFFRFNTDSDLLNERINFINEVMKDVEKLVDGQDNLKPELRKKASRFKPFGIYIRNLLEDVFPGKPELVPTSEEELNWLVDDLLARLEQGLRALSRSETNSEREANERKIKETCWSLAVLWKDPPALTPEYIKGRIDELDRLDKILPFFAQL